ncbi:hypothetical protein [Nocardioides sp.]|jgi:hypothetical protein|uniref:hypothetical protein n=1 Tax=Nocardioides sp. TaxID=35761 RepID=UPI0031FE8D3E|nr:hypothetical protein [Nocardioides sp.]
MSRSRSTALVILAILSLFDLAGPLMTDGDHPPMSIALAGSVLGLLSLVCVGYVARGADRAVAPLALLRVVSALTAVPAFFVDDVPVGVRVLVAALIVVTGVGVWLLVKAPARHEAMAR